MIAAFIRGDNRPSRDLLAADPSSPIRAIPSSGPLGTFREPNRGLRAGLLLFRASALAARE